jgi:hypothetical protein
MEEQRFCWTCQKWFHLTCLERNNISNQEEYVKQIQATMGLQDVPQIIFQTAYQPTARGGLTHFTAGNLRIVKFARDLLEAQKRNEVADNASWFIAHVQEVEDHEESNITENDWGRFMEDTHGIKEENQGRKAYEQLVVHGQSMVVCPLCKAGI